MCDKSSTFSLSSFLSTRYYPKSPTVVAAKVTIGENKQFSDNRLTVKSNAKNFKADYKFDVMVNFRGGAGHVFEMKVTELNSGTDRPKITARFSDKVRC